MPALKDITTYLAALSGTLAPPCSVILIFITLRYRAYTKRNIIEITIAIILSVVAYVYFTPHVRFVMMVYNIAFIIVIIAIWGFSKLMSLFR